MIELTAEETALAKRLAEETYQRYRGEPGHYRNLPRSHLLGKLGEVAVESWFRSEGVDPDPAYRDPERAREPDLVVDAGGIEVKCWRPETWPEMGRCVTPAQIRGIRRKSVAIVWGVVEDEREPVRVELVGWSTPEDVAATEVRATGPDYKPVVNHQVDAAGLRDLQELLGYGRP